MREATVELQLLILKVSAEIEISFEEIGWFPEPSFLKIAFPAKEYVIVLPTELVKVILLKTPFLLAGSIAFAILISFIINSII